MPSDQYNWKNLRASYEKTHAPRELEERLVKMLKENTGKEQRNPCIIWGKRAAACLCCLLLGIASISNINASAAEALQKIPVIGAVSRVVTFRRYQVKDTDIKTPHITGIGDRNVENKLNQEFDKYADTLIKQYESDVQSMGPDAKEAVKSSYRVLVNNASQLTIVMNTTVFKGDSMENDWYYNIDKKTGSLLKLSELFKNHADYAAPLSAYLLEEIRKAPDDYFTENDAFKPIAADQNFYVNQDGKLVLVFDEGSIAPAYKGVVEFTIPTDRISNILSTNSLVRSKGN